MKTGLRAFWEELKSIVLALPGAVAPIRRRLLLTLLAGALVTGLLAWLADPAWTAAGERPFGLWAEKPGQLLSRYNELHWSPLITGLMLWILGYKFRRVRWREAAVAALLAAGLFGGLSAVMKGVIGRARPDLRQPYEFVGPNLRADTQGFPSGHTTHCVAFAVTVVLLAPEVGVPALIIPALGIFGRLALHKHYPSDIAGGATLGILGAMIAAEATRRRKKSGDAAPGNSPRLP